MPEISLSLLPHSAFSAVSGGSTSSDISLTSTESSSGSSPSSGHYDQLTREMSKPLIIASDQSLTSSTCTDTSNTTDSNENPDVEKRRQRVKPETILELEERPVSSASDGELAEVERARERMERMYAKDQEGADRYERLLLRPAEHITVHVSFAAEAVITGAIGAPTPAELGPPTASATRPFVSITRTWGPLPVTSAATGSRTTAAVTFRTQPSR